MFLYFKSMSKQLGLSNYTVHDLEELCKTYVKLLTKFSSAAQIELSNYMKKGNIRVNTTCGAHYRESATLNGQEEK